MKLVNYIRNDSIDILKLKQDLMNKEITSSTSVNTKSSENEDKKELGKTIREILNTDLGIIFEENIREILKRKYGFIRSTFPRKVIYRKIKTSSNSIILYLNEKKEFDLNGITHTFIFNEDFSITVKANYMKKDEVITEYKEEIVKIYNKKKITITPKLDIEADGIFNIKEFQLSLFDKEEIEILFSNVTQNYTDFNMAIIEAKLSGDRISEMVKQIEKDDNVLGKRLNKKIIYLGFINSTTIKSEKELNYLKSKKINCIVLGIKSSIFGKIYVLKPIYWDLADDVDEIKNKLTSMEAKLNNALSFISDLNQENKIKKDKTFINKKRSKEEKKLINKKKGKDIIEEDEDDEEDLD